jgi:ketopantoate reductase
VSETIFETKSDRYQLVNVGWKDDSTRIYGCVLHVDIKDGKIWVQHDGTEEAIAEQLVERGVPKQEIVLADHAPHVYPSSRIISE